jgi:hypothetical protein
MYFLYMLLTLGQNKPFHVSLIFVSKAGEPPLDLSLLCNHQTRVEVTDSDKHASLLRHRNNHDLKCYIGPAHKPILHTLLGIGPGINKLDCLSLTGAPQ